MQYRNYDNPLSQFFGGSVVKQLVAINVVVFILQVILVNTSFQYFFALRPQLVIRGFIWQLVTYMFLHGGLWHILINMFIIWMFGTTLERVWGSSRFLKFYFICGIGGAIGSFIFAFDSAVIGASGAGYGILVAYAVLFPHNQVFVWGLFPVRARTLVIVLVVIEFINGISGGRGIAHFAHLGGMAAGFIYLKGDYRAWRLRSRIRKIIDKIPIKIKSDSSKDRSKDDPPENPGSSKIDSILDKISSKGYENLSETEKRILENYSREKEDR